MAWLDKQIKKLRKKIEKYKFVHLILILILSGCVTTNPIRTTDELKQSMILQDRLKVFKIYDNNTPNLIILAYERVYSDTFEIAKNYLQYTKEDTNPTYDGFWVWLCKNLWYKDRWDKGDEFGSVKWLIENRIKDPYYQDIKKNYELLEKMR